VSLETGKSSAAFSQNVKTEMAAGKPQKQAVAIAYSEARKDANPYRSWAEWNEVYTKLLQKRNVAQRDIDKFWKAGEEKLQQNARNRLAKAESDLAEHQKHYIPSTPTYAFGSRRDSADNSTIPVGVNDTTVPAPRSDGETARAERAMRSDVISKVCDAAVRVADRCARYMDSMEARRDADESPGSKREHALVEARGKVSRLQKQMDEMAAEKGEAIKTELEAAKETLAQLEGGAVEKDDKVSVASAEDKAKDSKSVKDSLAEARAHLVSLQGSRVDKNSTGTSRSGNPLD
jgi:hypothetical protein